MGTDGLDRHIGSSNVGSTKTGEFVMTASSIPITTFDKALEFVLKEEGGYINDPDDAGGATNFGIIQRTYDLYREEKSLSKADVQFIGGEEVRYIYFHSYWKAGKCSELPSKIAMIHFDGFVNIRGANKVLQRTINVFITDLIDVDGNIGPKTLTALSGVVTALSSAVNVNTFIDELLWHRVIYYRRRVDKRPVNIKFLRNWLVRLEHLRDFINE